MITIIISTISSTHTNITNMFIITVTDITTTTNNNDSKS